MLLQVTAEMHALEVEPLHLLPQLGVELAGAAEMEVARRVRVACNIGGISVEREAQILLRHEARNDGEMAVGVGHAMGSRQRAVPRLDPFHRDRVVSYDDAAFRQAEERQKRLPSR